MAEKRRIFEEVGSVRATGGPSRPARRNDARLIDFWLKTLFVLVTAMILVGGLTRLTDSGLSITEWAPVSGALPPMTAEAWQVEFEKYQAIPEFRLQNADMTLAAFKGIYWWEWGHRFLGRFIGLVWAVGMVALVVRQSIPRGWTVRFLALGFLGGVQGAIGWWMVSSGLTGHMVDVASYRLAIHLGLAFAILGMIAWFSIALRRGEPELLQARRRREPGQGALAVVLVIILFAQILLGALVAGLDAGRGYTDWPLMGGQMFPDSALNLSPVWLNVFENVALTQFNHRMLAYLFCILVAYAFWKSRNSALRMTRYWYAVLAVFTALQAVIGIVTVLNAAPLGLGLLHQFGAIILWIVMLRCRFEDLYPRSQSLR